MIKKKLFLKKIYNFSQEFLQFAKNNSLRIGAYKTKLPSRKTDFLYSFIKNIVVCVCIIRSENFSERSARRNHADPRDFTPSGISRIYIYIYCSNVLTRVSTSFAARAHAASCSARRFTFSLFTWPMRALLFIFILITLKLACTLHVL